MLRRNHHTTHLLTGAFCGAVSGSLLKKSETNFPITSSFVASACCLCYRKWRNEIVYYTKRYYIFIPKHYSRQLKMLALLCMILKAGVLHLLYICSGFCSLVSIDTVYTGGILFFWTKWYTMAHNGLFQLISVHPSGGPLSCAPPKTATVVNSTPWDRLMTIIYPLDKLFLII